MLGLNGQSLFAFFFFRKRRFLLPDANDQRGRGETVDAADLKSVFPRGSAGSSPAARTNVPLMHAWVRASGIPPDSDLVDSDCTDGRGGSAVPCLPGAGGGADVSLQRGMERGLRLPDGFWRGAGRGFGRWGWRADEDREIDVKQAAGGGEGVVGIPIGILSRHEIRCKGLIWRGGGADGRTAVVGASSR